MSESVEHFVEGRNAWKLGIVGYFTRVRGVLTAVVITFATMGTPFWWPDNFPKQVTIDYKIYFSFYIFLFGLMAIFLFLYVRKRAIRSLDIKHYLHELSHYIRDIHTQICEEMNGEKQKRSRQSNKKIFKVCCKDLCERIKDLFVGITGDHTIEVAVRIASVNRKCKNESIEYVTAARSSGFNKNRHKNSEGISSGEGIPRFFLERESKGILIYNDLKKAAAVGAYKITKNDAHYPDEIKTMMVAPLNAWDGKNESMIGLLYVTSRNDNIFSVKDIDSMRFIADISSKTISDAVNAYYL